MKAEHSLIRALIIFEKYNPNFSTYCEHDVFSIRGIEPSEVSDEDKELLDLDGFHIGDSCGEESFQSFRWGS